MKNDKTGVSESAEALFSVYTIVNREMEKENKSIKYRI